MYKDIDEAIEKYRQLERNARAIISALNDETSIRLQTQLAERYVQLAKWLEELKFLKTGQMTIYREVYNKAIDDAIAYFEIHAHEVYNHITARDFICDRLEQLKESKE